MQWNGSGSVLDWGLWIIFIVLIVLALWSYFHTR